MKCKRPQKLSWDCVLLLVIILLVALIFKFLTNKVGTSEIPIGLCLKVKEVSDSLCGK